MTMVIDVRAPGAQPFTAETYFRSTIRPAVFREQGAEQSVLETDERGGSDTITPVAGGFQGSINMLGVARHPVQLYEAAVALLLGIALFTIWWRKGAAVPPGLLLGWCLVLLFISRFFLEYLKEDVAAIEAGLPLKMGQMLSIPFVALGIWLVGRARRKEKE